MQTGEVGIEITPIIAGRSLESRFAPQLDNGTPPAAASPMSADQAATATSSWRVGNQ